MSNDEISEITGMSKTAVKANLHYARKNIAGMIENYL
jgi:DNA-directed RNA polymerase specialized sigma24 family protein